MGFPFRAWIRLRAANCAILIRVVANRNTVFGAGRHINIIEANGMVADDPQLGTSLQQFTIDPNVGCGEQNGAVGKKFDLHIPRH